MDTPSVVSFYTGLLIMQYASFGNAVGTVQAYVGALIQNQIISQVQSSFNLNTAIGNQLTILGTYRGVSRQIFGLSQGNFWSLIPYTAPAPNSYYGWATYSGPAPTSKWLQYSDITAFGTSLSDTQMRRFINFKVLLNSSPLTLQAIDSILYTTFGTYVNLIDNGNMTITYQHQVADPDPDALWSVVVLANALPHPCGVSYSVVSV